MYSPDTYPQLLVIFVAGLVVGSFLNVVIHRVPLQMQSVWRRESRDFLGMPPEGESPRLNLAFPASHCPHCREPIKPWHNVPVLSYLLLRGKCHHCKAPISIQYPLVELATALLATLAIGHFGLTAEGALAVLFSLALIVLTGIDFHHQLLPDIITLPLLWLGLLANSQGLFTDLNSAVIGAVAGYLVLWLVFWGFKLLTGKEGMGHGDFKLLAALGAWLGWQLLPLIVLLSSAVGAVIGVAAIAIVGRDRQIPMAFGPYLAIAGWIAMFWGEALVDAYLALL
jgi:leader peptidase (prepilin peptidase)/N-methyltransferase